MTPQSATKKIQNACIRRPELCYREWPRIPAGATAPEGLRPFQGFCYIATEVFCHVMNMAGIRAVPYCDDFRSHFWACIGDTVWDLTADQFSEPFPYECGRPTSFKLLSRRASALLSESGLRG